MIKWGRPLCSEGHPIALGKNLRKAHNPFSSRLLLVMSAIVKRRPLARCSMRTFLNNFGYGLGYHSLITGLSRAVISNRYLELSVFLLGCVYHHKFRDLGVSRPSPFPEEGSA